MYVCVYVNNLKCFLLRLDAGLRVLASRALPFVDAVVMEYHPFVTSWYQLKFNDNVASVSYRSPLAACF